MKIRSILHSRGFALVVTITLLVLLAVIALGFLSLSAVTLRSGTQNQVRADAEANARLALQIAIGELQKQMGPDQRISASGAILDTLNTNGSVQEPAKNPHWTGVWDSWIAGHKATAAVKSDYPGAESKHQTIGNQPDTSVRPEDDQKDKHFRARLVSLLPEDVDEVISAKNLVLNGKEFPGKDDNAIRLVGSGSTSSTDYVSARLMRLPPKGGRCFLNRIPKTKVETTKSTKFNQSMGFQVLPVSLF